MAAATAGVVPMKVRPSSPKVIVTKTGNGVLSRQASSAALGFEQVGEGFEKDEIAAGCAGGAGLLGEDIVGLLEAELPERGKQRPGRTDVTGNERCSRITCDLGCGCVELVDARVMIRELEAVRAEGIGGDATLPASTYPRCKVHMSLACVRLRRSGTSWICERPACWMRLPMPPSASMIA